MVHKEPLWVYADYNNNNNDNNKWMPQISTKSVLV